MSLKPVFSAASETEAEIVRNLLESAGIEAEISSDDGGGLIQSLAYASGVNITVDEKDFGDAMVVLEEYRKGQTALTEEDGE